MRANKQGGLIGLLMVGVMLAAVMLPTVLQAQVTPPSPQIEVLGVTNNVPNNSTTTANLGGVIDCSRYKEVGLQFKFALNAAGTTACTFTFVRSADGTNWNTSAPISISVAPNGTTPVVTNTTVTMGPMPYLKLSSLVAANNTAAMTNIVVVAVRKPDPRD